MLRNKQFYFHVSHFYKNTESKMGEEIWLVYECIYSNAPRNSRVARSMLVHLAIFERALVHVFCL